MDFNMFVTVKTHLSYLAYLQITANTPEPP
jgi:hypothetical protein